MLNIPWKFKSTCFKIIDIFNLYPALYFLQKHITRRSITRANKIDICWTKHAYLLKKHNATGLVFEFGAGKSLGQNLYLSSVVGNQMVVDINPMIDLGLVESARITISNEVDLRSSNPIRTLHDLASYGISYVAPFDASNTSYEDKTFDACVSTSTLEHLTPDQLTSILFEIHRVLKDNGIFSAHIVYSDHYSHTDKNINPLNFLLYSDRQWSKYNHVCHYQNRLRHYEFLEIFHRSGFDVIEEDVHYSPFLVPKEISIKYHDKPSTWSATSAHVVLKKRVLVSEAQHELR